MNLSSMKLSKDYFTPKTIIIESKLLNFNEWYYENFVKENNKHISGAC